MDGGPSHLEMWHLKPNAPVEIRGEFGQITSSVGANKKDGRDHWPYCYTVLFAGGGVPGGAVIGSSDATAARPKENPATPDDVAATIYTLLEIDPTTELKDGQDKPYTLAPGTPIKVLV